MDVFFFFFFFFFFPGEWDESPVEVPNWSML